MNQRLTERLSKFSEMANNAKSINELTNVVVETERIVFKSNFEDRQGGGPEANYETREFVVGEANTRGISWKLNLLRAVADANFSKMVRVGVHGGQAILLGQPDNLDITFAIYHALEPVYERLGKTAFDEFMEAQQGAEGTEKINRGGWINQWLVASPANLTETINESRNKDAASNGKLANLLVEKDTALQSYLETVTPPKPVKTPKAPKAPKEPKAKKGKKAKDPLEEGGYPEPDGDLENELENEDSESTLAEPDGQEETEDETGNLTGTD